MLKNPAVMCRVRKILAIKYNILYKKIQTASQRHSKDFWLQFPILHCQLQHWIYVQGIKKGKGSPYSVTECRVPELITVLGSQPAGDVSHKPGGRLPILSAKPAVIPATLKRAATNFTAWWTEAQWVWTVCPRLLPDTVVAATWTQVLLHLSPAS